MSKTFRVPTIQEFVDDRYVIYLYPASEKGKYVVRIENQCSFFSFVHVVGAGGELLFGTNQPVDEYRSEFVDLCEEMNAALTQTETEPTPEEFSEALGNYLVDPNKRFIKDSPSVTNQPDPGDEAPEVKPIIATSVVHACCCSARLDSRVMSGKVDINAMPHDGFCSLAKK